MTIVVFLKDSNTHQSKLRNLLLNYLFREYKVPYVDTFIYNDYNETMDYIKKTNYPFISKINICRLNSCGICNKVINE